MLLPVLASCHFLEVEKTGKTFIKNFYSDVYALDAAVNGKYILESLHIVIDIHVQSSPEFCIDLKTHIDAQCQCPCTRIAVHHCLI